MDCNTYIALLWLREVFPCYLPFIPRAVFIFMVHSDIQIGAELQMMHTSCSMYLMSPRSPRLGSFPGPIGPPRPAVPARHAQRQVSLTSQGPIHQQSFRPCRPRACAALHSQLVLSQARPMWHDILPKKVRVNRAHTFQNKPSWSLKAAREASVCCGCCALHACGLFLGVHWIRHMQANHIVRLPCCPCTAQFPCC